MTWTVVFQIVVLALLVLFVIAAVRAILTADMNKPHTVPLADEFDDALLAARARLKSDGMDREADLLRHLHLRLRSKGLVA